MHKEQTFRKKQVINMVSHLNNRGKTWVPIFVNKAEMWSGN